MRKVFIPLVLALLLPLAQHVRANDSGYIVKFNSDISAFADIESFNPISENHNLYRIDSPDQLLGLEEYVVYYEENVPIEHIRGDIDLPETNLFAAIDPADIDQWQLRMIHSDYAHDFSTLGNGVNVAVIDSGCNPHSELADSLAGGYDYVNNSEDFTDNIGHGTHVCGIIAAAADGTGITGVAPKANLYALKCIEKDVKSHADLLAAILYDAVDKYNCKVINMSLGVRGDVKVIGEAVQYALSKDVIIIAAVGNSGTGALYYPAAYEGVIGIGSVGQTKEKSTFSEVNQTVFVTAPGEGVASLSGTSDYATMRGTSQAAPHVTGLAAIMRSADPKMTAEQFKEYLKTTSEDLGEEGYDTSYGHGLVNVQALFDRFLKDRPHYVSPVNDGAVLVYNGTDQPMTSLGIWAEYDAQGKYLKGTFSPLTLQPGEKQTISRVPTEHDAKFMLWESLTSMRPLSLPRA